MKTQIIDGNKIAQKIKKRLRRKLFSIGIKPRLAVLTAELKPSAEAYLERQKKDCADTGIIHKLYHFGGKTAVKRLIEKIHELNSDSATSGIMLMTPLPAGADLAGMRAEISPAKDVEGVTPFNLGRIASGNGDAVPCTALAILETIESAKVKLKSAEVVVVGNSQTSGLPAALLLMSKGATVTVCDINTACISSHTKRAGILVSAAGSPGLIGAEMIKKGAFIADVGYTVSGRGRASGDIIFKEALGKAAFLTPVPGGIGPVTSAMLLKNTVTLFEKSSRLRR